MLVFDPQDPFPLIDAVDAGSGASYRESQTHAGSVDDWLGFKLDTIETKLSDERPHSRGVTDEQHWIGLPIQTLQTPYTEIRFLLSLLDLRPGDHVVDLGAGYGRMGFVLAAHHPGVRFTGYEVVKDRVEEGTRVLRRFLEAREHRSRQPLVSELIAARIELLWSDLSASTFKPRVADFYFIYDFGSRSAISKTLADLKSIASTKQITVIGRGRASRDAIERGEPWLSQVNEPRHFDHFSIYQS